MCGRLFHIVNAEEALADITYYQLRMWLAYIELEPVESEAGLVASMLANVNRATKNAPLFKPTDFSAFVVEEETVRRTPEERWAGLAGQMDALARASRKRKAAQAAQAAANR